MSAIILIYSNDPDLVSIQKDLDGNNMVFPGVLSALEHIDECEMKNCTAVDLSHFEKLNVC